MRSFKRSLFTITVSALAFAGLAIGVQAQTGNGESLSGSYRLDRNASEDTRAIVANTAGRGNVSQSDIADLSSKLEAPETITLAISGSRVSLATSLGGSPANFDADGVPRSSVRQDGREVTVRAGFRGDTLTISSLGGDTDYTLVFAPADNGNGLRVTRRITTPYLTETVFADSFYVRTDGYSGSGQPSGDSDYSSSDDDRAYSSSNDDKTYSSSDDDKTYSSSGDDKTYSSSDDDKTYSSSDDDKTYSSSDDDKTYSSSDDDKTYSSSGDNRPYSSSDPNDFPVRNGGTPQQRIPRTGTFAVPSGTILKGKLATLITTKASQENDPFRVTVESPSEFGGAVIEGYITGIERTGRISGRSSITLNFSSITFSDGRRFDFAGVLSEVTAADGEQVSVTNEGEIQGGSRTNQTLKRSGVGAGIGAVLGAILGGGRGAIIGATIGAGAGAGSMIPGGRGDLELDPGASLTITSTGPGGK